MEERFRSTIVMDLFIERENEETQKKEILMLLRQNTGFGDGMYDLPGGHVDPNEDIIESAIREAKEEIGIDIKRENVEIKHIYHQFNKEKLKFVLKVNKYDNELINGEPDKCKELRWFELDKLPENIIPIIKKELENIKNSVYYDCD